MSTQLSKPSLAELRQLIGSHENQLQEKSSFSLYPDGIKMGCLVELTGHRKTSWLALFLKEHPDYKVAWVEKEITINPYALFQHEVDLTQILFIEAKNQLMWCLSQAVSSGCFKVMVTDHDQMNEKDLRRCQLLSEKHQAHFFMLSEKTNRSWVPRLKIASESILQARQNPSAEQTKRQQEVL